MNGDSKASKKIKNITRLDYQKTHGWWVRIKRYPDSFSKLFSDGVWGGKDKALEAALEWRDQKLAEAPLRTERFNELSSKGFKTGVPGLSLSYEKGKKRPLPHLQVSIQRHGTRIGRRFSIKKWGLRGALWKACVVISKDTRVDGKLPDRETVQASALKLYNKSFELLEETLAAKGYKDLIKKEVPADQPSQLMKG